MKIWKSEISQQSAQKLKWLYWISAACCILIFAVAVYATLSISTESRARVVGVLDGYVSATKHAVENRIDGDFETLEGLALGMAALETPAQPDGTGFFDSGFVNNSQLYSSFRHLGRIGLDGKGQLIDESGQAYGVDFSGKDFFTKAAAGQRGLGQTVQDPLSGRQLLGYGAPIVSKGQVTGVVVGVCDIQRIALVLDEAVYNGDGYANISDSQGNFIVRSSKLPNAEDSAGVYAQMNLDEATLQQILTAMANRETIRYSYTDLDGRKMTAVCAPLGVNDWYAHCARGETYVAELSSRAIIGVMSLVALTLLMGILIFRLAALRQNRMETRLQAARYQSLQNITKDTIFEYQVQQDRLTITEFRSGGPKQREIPGYYHQGLYKNHTDKEHVEAYGNLIKRLSEAPITAAMELPMRLITGEFVWNRLSCQSLATGKRVTHFIGTAVDIDALVRAREAAQKEALEDPLTGALSRKAFFEQARQRYTANPQKEAVLLMIDLDNFKMINDVLGHVEGDRELRLVVSILTRVFSADDLIGRYGGDEFVVYLENITHQAVEKRLLQFKRLLRQEQFGEDMILTCSVGVIFANAQVLDFDQLIKQADEAMYQAKNMGKDRYILLDAETLTHANMPETMDLPGYSQQAHSIQLRALLDFMDAGVLLLEMADPIMLIYASKAYYTMNGANPQDYPTPRPAGAVLVFPEDADMLLNTLRSGVETEAPVECVYRSDPEGKCWRHLRAVRIPYAASEHPVLIAVETDITALWRNGTGEYQRNFEQNLDRFTKALAGAFVEVCEVDYNAEIITVRVSKNINPNVLGMPRSLEHAINHWLSEQTVPDPVQRKRVRDMLSRKNGAEQQLPVEAVVYQHKAHDGKLLWIRAILLKMDQEKSLFCIQDVTPNLGAEAEPESAG